MLASSTLDNLLTVYRFLKGDVNKTFFARNIAEISKKLKIEVPVIVSKDLMTDSELNKIVFGVLDVYISLFIQSIKLLDLEAINVTTIRNIDKINPSSPDLDKDLIEILLDSIKKDTSVTVSYIYSRESYKDLENKYDLEHSYKSLTTEDFDKSLPGREGYRYLKELDIDVRKFSLGKNIASENQRYDVTDISKDIQIGKLVKIDVKIQSQENPENVTIPLIFVANCLFVNNDIVVLMCKDSNVELSLPKRFRELRRGNISFFKDFLFFSDAIKKLGKYMIKDESRVLYDLYKRYNTSEIIGALTDEDKFSSIASIMIISENIENEIKYEYGADLDNLSVRNKVENNTLSLMIGVYDRDWKRVRLFLRGSKYPVMFSPKSGMGGTNIMEILSMFSLGQGALR
ncbi:MAG: hypothetical protein QXF12_07075 [Candidatus Aenigmatarchaeota archaeon]